MPVNQEEDKNPNENTNQSANQSASKSPSSNARPKPGRTGSRVRGVITGTIGAVLLVALGWAMFAPKPLPVEVATVVKGALQVAVEDEGQVRAHEKYVMAAPVAAELQRLDLRDGDPVKKGDVIASLNPLPMDARQSQEAIARLDAAQARAQEASRAVQRASVALELASRERQRVANLVKERFVSEQAGDKAVSEEKIARAEQDAARSRLRAAEADIKAAQAALIAMDGSAEGARRQLQLRSPVDGYALKVHEKSRRTVPAGTPLVTIGDPTRYEIVTDVLSSDAVKIRPGQTMLLDGWGGGTTLRARVRVVEPVAFTKISVLGVEEQRVNVVADPVDDLGPLGDGYRIDARIVIWEADEVIKAPASSLFRVGQAWHVFVIEDDRAQEREVRVGQRNQDEVQLLGGVDVGTVLVRFPGNQLAHGMRVVPKNGS